MKYIKNFDRKYAINEEGRLFRRSRDSWVEMKAHANGQVELRRNGKVFKPLLRTVVNETLGTSPEPEVLYDSVLLRRLKRAYRREKDPVIIEFLKRVDVELGQHESIDQTKELKMNYGREIDGVGGVYEIRCSEDGRRYVGSSKNMRARAYAHESDLQKGEHGNTPLQMAWDKYGPDAFSFHVVIESCGEDIKRLEQIRIDLYSDFDKLFNVMGCVLRSDESIKALREAYWWGDELNRLRMDFEGHHIGFKGLMRGYIRPDAPGPVSSMETIFE